MAVGEQPDTVEEVCEPFLVRAGLLARTPRGRVATEAGLAPSGAHTAEWYACGVVSTGPTCSPGTPESCS